VLPGVGGNEGEEGGKGEEGRETGLRGGKLEGQNRVSAIQTTNPADWWREDHWFQRKNVFAANTTKRWR